MPTYQSVRGGFVLLPQHHGETRGTYVARCVVEALWLALTGEETLGREIVEGAMYMLMIQSGPSS